MKTTNDVIDRISGTHDITNNNLYSKMMYKKMKQSPVNLIVATQKNVKNFNKMWGRANFRYEGEFVYSVWEREFSGETFLVFSSDKGTSYEIKTDEGFMDFRDNKVKGSICFDFISEIIDTLLQMDSNREKYKDII